MFKLWNVCSHCCWSLKNYLYIKCFSDKQVSNKTCNLCWNNFERSYSKLNALNSWHSAPVENHFVCSCLDFITLTSAIFYKSGPQLFWHQGSVSGRQFFHELGWGCFQDDSSTLYLLCTLFLLLHQRHSEHQALHPWGWGLLVYRTEKKNWVV